MSKVVALIARFVIFRLFLAGFVIFLLECILTIKDHIFNHNSFECIIFLGGKTKKKNFLFTEIYVFDGKIWYRGSRQALVSSKMYLVSRSFHLFADCGSKRRPWYDLSNNEEYVTFCRLTEIFHYDSDHVLGIITNYYIPYTPLPLYPNHRPRVAQNFLPSIVTS